MVTYYQGTIRYQSYQISTFYLAGGGAHHEGLTQLCRTAQLCRSLINPMLGAARGVGVRCSTRRRWQSRGALLFVASFGFASSALASSTSSGSGDASSGSSSGSLPGTVCASLLITSANATFNCRHRPKDEVSAEYGDDLWYGCQCDAVCPGPHKVLHACDDHFHAQHPTFYYHDQLLWSFGIFPALGIAIAMLATFVLPKEAPYTAVVLVLAIALGWLTDFVRSPMRSTAGLTLALDAHPTIMPPSPSPREQHGVTTLQELCCRSSRHRVPRPCQRAHGR